MASSFWAARFAIHRSGPVISTRFALSPEKGIVQITKGARSVSASWFEPAAWSPRSGWTKKRRHEADGFRSGRKGNLAPIASSNGDDPPLDTIRRP